MHVHNRYKIKWGDTLSRIGRKFGYSNAGPIYAYPLNNQFFKKKSPNDIKAGQQIYIPYHPDLLRKIISTSEFLIEDTIKFMKSMLRRESIEADRIKNYLVQMDVISCIGTIVVSLASFSIQAARGTVTSSQALKWLLLDHEPGLWGNVTTLVVPSPSKPKRDFRFLVRHTLGPWSPSYWVHLWLAFKDKDEELFLFGTDAIVIRNKNAIKKQAYADIEKLRRAIITARTQLSMPFYSRRI